MGSRNCCTHLGNEIDILGSESDMYSLGTWEVGIACNHLGNEIDILGSESDMYSLGTWEVGIAVLIWEMRLTYWEARVTYIHLARGK